MLCRNLNRLFTPSSHIGPSSWCESGSRVDGAGGGTDTRPRWRGRGPAHRGWGCHIGKARMATKAAGGRREEAEGVWTGCVGASLFPEDGRMDGLRWESGKRPGDRRVPVD